MKVGAAFAVSFTYADLNGRYNITKLSTGDEKLFVVNIYAPNHYNEQSNLIRNLGVNLIAKTDTTKLIISGDWTPKDKQGALPWRGTDYRNSITDLMDEIRLVDIYRKLHPT